MLRVTGWKCARPWLSCKPHVWEDVGFPVRDVHCWCHINNSNAGLIETSGQEGPQFLPSCGAQLSAEDNSHYIILTWATKLGEVADPSNTHRQRGNPQTELTHSLRFLINSRTKESGHLQHTCNRASFLYKQHLYKTKVTTEKMVMLGKKKWKWSQTSEQSN